MPSFNVLQEFNYVKAGNCESWTCKYCHQHKYTFKNVTKMREHIKKCSSVPESLKAQLAGHIPHSRTPVNESTPAAEFVNSPAKSSGIVQVRDNIILIKHFFTILHYFLDMCIQLL